MNTELIEVKSDIVEIKARVSVLEEFKVHCAENHHAHIRNDDIHQNTSERHLELINKTILSQDAMAASITELSNSLKSLSYFINTNKSALELLFSIVTGLKGFKRGILGLAAIISAIGVLVGASITLWVIFSSPHILDTLIKIGSNL